MANKLYKESDIEAIADSIRAKSGKTDTYKVSEMAAAINNLGRSMTLKTYKTSITVNFKTIHIIIGIATNSTTFTYSTFAKALYDAGYTSLDNSYTTIVLKINYTSTAYLISSGTLSYYSEDGSNLTVIVNGEPASADSLSKATDDDVTIKKI